MANLNDCQLVIGQLAYFHGLLQDLQLTPVQQQLLQTAVDRNSEAQLTAFLRDTPLRTQQRRAIEEILQLSGDSPSSIIDQADRFCLNYTMHAALENLRAICRVLDAFGISDRIFLDLTEIHNLGYYTGMTFEALAPELGFPLASGGRYDNLVGTFGPAQPAVGVALVLDRILVALRQREATRQPSGPLLPHLLVATSNSPACLSLVKEWRRRGLRVAIDVDEKAELPLWERARKLRIAHAVAWTGQGFDLYVSDDVPVRPPQYLPASESDQLLSLLLSHSERQATG